MKKPALLVVVFALSALPSFAQMFQGPTSEFGILFGGSKRLVSTKDEAAGRGVQDNFSFSNSVKEAYYSVALDPETRFKIKVGQLNGPGAFQFILGADKQRVDINDVAVDYVDGIVDYRFNEPFGSTGLFGGIGYYRQQGTIREADVPANLNPADVVGRQSESNYGFVAGVNGDFPLSRNMGVIVEGSYHAVNYHARPRYVTISGGLRFSF